MQTRRSVLLYRVRTRPNRCRIPTLGPKGRLLIFDESPGPRSRTLAVAFDTRAENIDVTVFWVSDVFHSYRQRSNRAISNWTENGWFFEHICFGGLENNFPTLPRTFFRLFKDCVRATLAICKIRGGFWAHYEQSP